MRIAIASALCLLATSAQAFNLSQYKRPNIHWGQVQLHPFYILSETYDTNIYLVPKDQPVAGQVGGGVKSSWITKNNFGLEAVLPVRKVHTYTAGYSVEHQLYSTQPSVNNATNQNAHLDYEYKGAYGVTVSGGDRYVNTTDQAFSELIERNRRWMNQLWAEVDFAPERSRLVGGVDASHTTHKYVSGGIGKSLNRYEQKAGFNVGYMIMPKTKLYGAYHRSVIHYTVHRQFPDQDKNNKSNHVGVGLKGQLAPKFDGKLEAGMVFREYDEVPVGGTTKNTENLTVDGQLTFRQSPNTEWALMLERRLQESLAGRNRYFVANSAVLDVKHKLPRKFSVGGNLAYAVDKYEEPQNNSSGALYNRRDDIYQYGVWVAYDIQEWLTAGVSFLSRERNSTMSGEFNYHDEQTQLNLALKF